MATSSVGVMAIERVSRTREKRDQRRFKKPYRDMEVVTRPDSFDFLEIIRCSYLHDKLAGVSSCHGGALSCCQDANGPDVESSRAKETAQHHTLEGHKPKGTDVQTPLWDMSHFLPMKINYGTLLITST